MDLAIRKIHFDAPQIDKQINAYLAYCMSTGIVLFMYIFITKEFALEAFFAAFISCVGCFVLMAQYRMLVNMNKTLPGCNITRERRIAEWLLACLVLQMCVSTMLMSGIDLKDDPYKEKN